MPHPPHTEEMKVETLLKVIDENREEQFQFLCDLISLKSITGNEGEAQDFVEGKMKDMGLAVESWDINFSELKKLNPSFSHIEEKKGRRNVVGTLEGTGGKTLILNGHIDVVEAGEGWRFEPWKGRMQEGKIYGRGACDMKGGLTSIIFAIDALRKTGIDLKGNVIAESVIGEEEGGTGTLAALQKYRGDAAIITEPTRLSITTAQEGALTFRLTIKGKAAHACVRKEGVSAIEKFLKVHKAIRLFESERNRKLNHPLYKTSLPFPILIGKVRAGNWDSTVPDSLIAEGRFGISPCEKTEKAKRQFEKMIGGTGEKDAWLKKNPVTLEWTGGQFEPAEISPRELIVKSLARSFSGAAKRKPVIEGMTYGADMRLFVQQGIPAVMFGAGDVRKAHFPDEFISCEELVMATKVLALTIMDFCKVL